MPLAATHFAFGYPPTTTGAAGGGGGGGGGGQSTAGKLGESFLAAGGFLYFARSSDGSASSQSYALCGATAFTRSAGQGLHFAGPVKLHSAACRQQLAAQRRLFKPTLELFAHAGVRHFCWLCPRERLGPHDGAAWPDGGFAYLFDDAEAELDCVFSLHECLEHEPIARLGPSSNLRAKSMAPA